MKTLLLVLISTACYCQVFVSPELSIGAATANSGFKGAFGIGGKIGVGYKIDKFHLSAVGSFSNFTFDSKPSFLTDASGNKTNEINSNYSATYSGIGVKFVMPIYAPNGDGLYFNLIPEYNFLKSVVYTVREQNKNNSPFNKDGSFSSEEMSKVGNSASIEIGVNYRIVGKNEFGFGASYKKVLSSNGTFPSLGMFGLNVVYQFNFKKKN